MHTAVELSIVIPAFNEATRLPIVLDDIRRHCSTEFGPAYEVIVVDDGSTDAMANSLTTLSLDWPQLHVVSHKKNRGKGAAVRTGMLAAIGNYLLFMDADGATPIQDEVKLRRCLDQGVDIAIGSRIVASSKVMRRRRWSRRLTGWVFRKSQAFFVDIPVLDTQCGFKMFRQGVAKELFANCDEDGYLFDIFVLRLAMQRGFLVRELPVSWREVEGSKVRMFRDSYLMWHGLRRIKWKLKKELR